MFFFIPTEIKFYPDVPSMELFSSVMLGNGEAILSGKLCPSVLGNFDLFLMKIPSL